MIIDWDIKEIKEEIDKIVWAATDPKMDGFTTWGAKQDLYKILWYAEDQLEKLSTYEGEDKFVKKRKQKRLVKLIKDSHDNR
tara:strand:- start:1172 stop:1417 length:246 start_codon:yes stop_codon:yes gene_type:complete